MDDFAVDFESNKTRIKLMVLILFKKQIVICVSTWILNDLWIQNIYTKLESVI